MSPINFCGVPISADPPAVILSQIKNRLQNPDRPLLICTPNPEIMLAARTDRLFHKILTQADFNIPDGTGLIWALRRAEGGSVPPLLRVSGVDFLHELLKILPTGQRVALLGAGLAGNAGTVKNLQKTFPQHTFRGWPGEIPEIRTIKPESQNLEDFKTAALTQVIGEFKPTVILAGLGAPRQEKWLKANLPQIPTVAVAMGVGGAFDMLAGLKPRAPLGVRKAGLEWLWRGIIQPTRFFRITKAVMIFPLFVLAGPKLKMQNEKCKTTTKNFK